MGAMNEQNSEMYSTTDLLWAMPPVRMTASNYPPRAAAMAPICFTMP